MIAEKNFTDGDAPISEEEMLNKLKEAGVSVVTKTDDGLTQEGAEELVTQFIKLDGSISEERAPALTKAIASFLLRGEKNEMPVCIAEVQDLLAMETQTDCDVVKFVDVFMGNALETDKLYNRVLEGFTGDPREVFPMCSADPNTYIVANWFMGTEEGIGSLVKDFPELKDIPTESVPGDKLGIRVTVDVLKSIVERLDTQ